MQRLRVKFCRGEQIKFISHLDFVRLWQRAFRRAGISLAYSKGFSPHPRISLAAPLAVGVTSEAELMDIVSTKWVSPQWFAAAMSQQLPQGVGISQVYSVALIMPSLQSQVRYAEYQVKVETDKEQKDIDSAITNLLAVDHLPWCHQRDTSQRNYDLRALIDDLWLIDWQQPYGTIGMRLYCDNRGSGRPEQVALALGILDHPQSIHRTRLILEAT